MTIVHPTRSAAAFIMLQVVLTIPAFIDAAGAAGNLDCTSGLRAFDPALHKRVYKIGVSAPDGEALAWQKFNMTFQDYLTATAGRRFDPPIEFEMVTTTLPILSWVAATSLEGEGEEYGITAAQQAELVAAAAENQVDFFYSDAGVYTCVGTENGAQPIATTVADYDNLKGGLEYQLDELAGVIFARKDRRDIVTIKDLKDKVIAATDIGSFARAQVQFYQMKAAGLDYVMDPKQVVFGASPGEIVRGVVRGDFDVGLVRTGILETQAFDDLGRVLDPDMFKVINQQMHVTEDGTVFPFQHSTDVFPEWPFYSAAETPPDVIQEVQDALHALGDHRYVGERIHYCKTTELCDSSNSSACGVCDSKSIDFFDPNARCDTTRELAELAWRAGNAGRHNGFRSPRSYFAVRNIQEAAGFLIKDDYGEWHCTRAGDLHGSITCPDGFDKLTKEQFESSCSNITCPEGLSCFCKPCTEAFVVSEYTEEHTGLVHSMKECTHKNEKEVDVCAYAEQTKKIIFRAYDVTMSDKLDVRAVMTVDRRFHELEVVKVSKGQYEFSFSYHQLAIGTLEVFVNDMLIPGMPVQVQVVPRNCEAEYGNRSPTEDGSCACGDKSFEFGESCMDSTAFAVTICAIVVACGLFGGCFYMRRKRLSNDQLWLINAEELHFNDPVEVIGQGGFGVVVLAQYRGTKVAIKRVLKPKGGVGSGMRGSIDGRCSGSVDGRVSLGNGSVEIVGKPQEKANTTNVTFDGPDIEAGDSIVGANSVVTGNSIMSGNSIMTDNSADPDAKENRSNRGSNRGSLDLDFLTKVGGGPQTFWQKMFPRFFKNQDLRNKVDLLGSSMMATENRAQGLKTLLCPWFDKTYQQREDFMAEMRLLSKLRHPYITTVMGAVVSNFSDPMLVMEYMEYGSLYDLLRNETMYAGGDIILQIVRDVAQGLRFLHSSKPPIFHGDLKARNILIDSRFRAKVADFGLSTKKNNGLTGTPYFMAPEYLRRKTDYTAACDIYSLGVIFFEIYAREEPYKGENVRQVLMKVCNPSVNKRPQIPDAMPPKFVEITKKCWSADPYYRPQAKDLDLLFMDMNQQDAEPLTREQISGRDGEKKNTMDMLYEVFPRHIADALKAGKKVEPEDHEMVTVFFSDIVGFTSISKKLPAAKVCDMLDRLYGEFDKLARAHQVFKVETIGDAYMGVTNLMGQQDDDHVKQIAEFAVEAIHAANQIYIDEDDEELGTIKIRVGFHSGPVVSNVIGTLNPRYGLFGDTVNTASRMESTSVAGKIHCSEKSAKLLQKQAPELRVRQRGKLAVKGKGEMVTYWVSPRRKQAEDPIDKLIDNKSFDCIVVADSRGLIKRVNKTAIRDFRYEAEEEMIGLNVSDLVGGDIDSQTHDAYLANYHARDKSDRTSTTLGRQRVLYAKRKDGSQFQCIVGVNAINDDALEEDMLIGYIRCLEMGNDPGPAAAASSGCPVKKEETNATGGCPVKKDTAASSGCPVMKDTAAIGGCPVSKSSDKLADAGDLDMSKGNLDMSLSDSTKTGGANSSTTGLTSLQRAVGNSKSGLSADKAADLLGQACALVASDSFSGADQTADGSTSSSSSGSNSNNPAALANSFST